MKLKERDRLQYTGFRAIWKGLDKSLSFEERFVTALCATSDEAFERILVENSELIEEWRRSNGY